MKTLTCTDGTHKFILAGDAILASVYSRQYRAIFKCLKCEGFRTLDKAGTIQMLGPISLARIENLYVDINMY